MLQFSTLVLPYVIFLVIVFPFLRPHTLVECQVATEICRNYNGENITCPPHLDYDKNIMKKLMKDCPLEATETSEISCHFFPEVMNKGKRESCHLHKDTVDCTRGFILRGTRQKRRGQSGHVFISVRFVGKIQPLPTEKEVEGNCDKDVEDCWEDEYDVSEYIAFALSEDRKMGDDVVLYCHPYLDQQRTKCDNDTSENKYPYPIGVAINKYYTLASGQQSYDAELIFGQDRGLIKPGNVTFYENEERVAFSVLDCSADISTFILLQSKSEISTGLELDMEVRSKLFGFVAVGSCLDRQCLGENAKPPLGDIVKRTSVMARHRRAYITSEKVSLYQFFENRGTVHASYKRNNFILYSPLILLMLNCVSL